MVFLQYSDIIPIIIVVIVFLIFPKLHKLLIPSMYSSILEFVYQGNVGKTLRSSIIRVISIIVLCIAFYEYFGFSSIQLYVGIFLGSFLIIWPALVQYRLYSFFRNKAKIVCFIGYVIFVVGSLVTGYATIGFLIPMIYNDKEFLISNNGINILITLFSYVMPISIESALAGHTKIVTHLDVDTFRQDIKLINRQIEFEDLSVQMYSYEIENYCKQTNVNVQLVETILLLEQLNRGQWYNKFIEVLICKITPFIAIKKDMTIGLGQIKVSTAKDILKKSPTKFVKKLLDSDFNISLCCKLLRKIINDYYYSDNKNSCNNIYEYIATEYLCGTWDSENRSVMIYTAILETRCPQIEYDCKVI